MTTLITVTEANAHAALHIRADKPDLYFLHYNTHWIGHGVANANIRCKFIEHNGTLVGFTAYGPAYKDDYLLEADASHIATVYHLVIKPEYQRQGIGEDSLRLIAQELMLQGHTELRVAHHPDAEKAARFYQKIGFQVIGKDYDDDTLLSIQLSDLA
ncbi:hypothetical protein GCM10011297_28030 [Bacterioplanes sanyensis]|uniref:GNAT family N-acetyltransferase n=1 Tax=Bacterioplanes sanyensis TaxID=1249553 RepID=UPI001677BB10|nr:GNAT family N-acetyltransferase [Bacterioplanes sanyensis]GGY53576.1 hypothetical protein GCM10011297_28030 [Bacterioplanes sanyensis]